MDKDGKQVMMMETDCTMTELSYTDDEKMAPVLPLDNMNCDFVKQQMMQMGMIDPTEMEIQQFAMQGDKNMMMSKQMCRYNGMIDRWENLTTVGGNPRCTRVQFGEMGVNMYMPKSMELGSTMI